VVVVVVALWSYDHHSLIAAGFPDEGYDSELVLIATYPPFSAVSNEMVAFEDLPNSVLI
jgi:hypothetical protein